MPDNYQQDGFAVVECKSTAAWSSALAAQADALQRSGATGRPWMYCELHNPWSRSATVVDSWAMLDLCQSPTLLDILADYIGDDIVLFDTQIEPIPALDQSDAQQWSSDSDFFPLVDGSDGDGIVVRIPFGPAEKSCIEFACSPSQCVEFTHGQILLHKNDIEYRLPTCRLPGQQELLIRFYSASVHFDRDPSNPKQVRLMERLPWLNYSKMPHWLVRGRDHANNDFVTGFRTKSGHWTMAKTIIPGC